MKKSILLIILGLLSILVLAACGSQPAPVKPTPTAAPAAKGITASEHIVAEGKVTPITNATLSFQTSGIVKSVDVTAGDRVEAGKVLAQLDTAQLNLQLAEADAKVASAQAKLNQVKRGPTPEDIAAAQQNLKSAQAAYDDLVKPSESDLAVLKADVDKTKAAVDQATAAYNAVGGDNNPQAGMLPQREQLQSAWIDYQRATSLYNARLKPTDSQVQQDLAAIDDAKLQSAKLQPTAEDIAAAQADVNAEQAARDLVAQQIKSASLVAPFGGTVITVDIDPGEFATAGTEVIRLANTGNWQVETTDLTELNVVNVSQGSPVTLTFDAIPGLELPGKVSSIRFYGENRQGDIVYTVYVKPDQQDARLRWNMTAKVVIGQ